MSYRTCTDCGSREHTRCYMSKPGPRVHIHTGEPVKKTGDTVVDMAVIHKITQLTDAVRTLGGNEKEAVYCIKELTKMVMELDKRVKFDNERIRQLELEVWELQK